MIIWFIITDDMEFYFQIKDSLQGKYYNGRKEGLNWCLECGKKRYHSVDVCFGDVSMILNSKTYCKSSIVIVKRYEINGIWKEVPLKVVKKKVENNLLPLKGLHI